MPVSYHRDWAREIRSPRHLRVDDKQTKCGIATKFRMVRRGVGQVSVLDAAVPRRDHSPSPRKLLEQTQRILLERHVEENLQVIDQHNVVGLRGNKVRESSECLKSALTLGKVQ